MKKNTFKNLNKNALRKEVKRKYGSKAFTKNNDIKLMYLRLMLKNADEKTKKRIIFSIEFQENEGQEMKNNKKIIIALFFSFIMLIGAFAVMTSGNSNNITLPVNNIPATANRTNPVNYYIELSGVPSGPGMYQQLITINNPSDYNINTKGSNIQFVASNGTLLYAWIQNINTTTMQVWIKNYYGSSTIIMQVFPSFENLFSENGYLGNSNPSTDNGRYVFYGYGNFNNTLYQQGWTYDNIQGQYGLNISRTNVVFNGTIPDNILVVYGWYLSNAATEYYGIYSDPNVGHYVQAYGTSNAYNIPSGYGQAIIKSGGYPVQSSYGSLTSGAFNGYNSTFGFTGMNAYEWGYFDYSNGYKMYASSTGFNYNDNAVPLITNTTPLQHNSTMDRFVIGSSFDSESGRVADLKYVILIEIPPSMPTYTIGYPVTISESGLPANTSWSFTFNGTLYTLTNTSYTILVNNGIYSLSVNAVNGYNDTYNSTIAVNFDDVNENIVFNFTYSINIIINNPDKAFYEITINENNNITHYNLTSSLITIHVINKNFPVTISINNLKKGYAISNPIISYDIAGNYSINEKIINTNNANNLVNNYTPYIIIVLILTALMIIGLIIKRGRE